MGSTSTAGAAVHAVVLHRDAPTQLYVLDARRARRRGARANARSGLRRSCSRPARMRRSSHTTDCACRPASTSPRRARLRGSAAARLLHPRRPAEPGAAQLRVVLDAADPGPHARTASPCSSRTSRGSTGYGADYATRVDRDWGGQDRLDHVHAMTRGSAERRPHRHRARRRDRPLVRRLHDADTRGRHPELGAAASTCSARTTCSRWRHASRETWKPFLALAIGDPEQRPRVPGRALASTYVDNIACPLLVIQGQNDPRVVEQESRDLVEHLRARARTSTTSSSRTRATTCSSSATACVCYETIVGFFSTTSADPPIHPARHGGRG